MYKYYWFYIGIFIYELALTQSIDPIHFDWSGQNGMSTDKGLLKWNQDWYSQGLLFDGTFQSYPLSFGEKIFTNSSFDDSYKNSFFFFPDSNDIETSFDYQQGDYLYDQFNVNAFFRKKNQIIEWNGFKRSYGGPFSQFIQDENLYTGTITPNQQSYFFQFISSADETLSILSIGKFITNSGLYNNSQSNGVHKNDITSASYTSMFHWKQFDINFKIDQYLEYRKWISEFSSASPHYINRGHLYGKISNQKNKSWDLGISANTQALIFSDTTISKKRSWLSVFGNFDNNGIQMSGGLDYGNKELLPLFSIKMEQNWNSVKTLTNILLRNKPQHLAIWSNKNSFFESWVNIMTTANIQKKSMRYYSIFNFWRATNLIESETDTTNSPKGMVSLESGFVFDHKSGIIISGAWIHSTSESFIADGIGDRIKSSFKINKLFFSDNMEITAVLSIEGLLNRYSSFGYDPAYVRPFRNEWESYVLPDYWTAHLDLKAKVSSVIITYRIRNFLHTQENAIKQLYKELPDEWLWPRNNAYFLPMGQLVSFGVEWEFKN